MQSPRSPETELAMAYAVASGLIAAIVVLCALVPWSA
jgi:hypothetical protein